MHVARDGALLDGEIGGAAERHVLADRADISLMVSATVLCRPETWPCDSLSRSALGLKRRLGDARRISWNASLRATKSVSELTSTSAACLASAGDADQTFRRDAAGLLGGLGEALGAQPIDRGLHVALGLVERRLAIHHARAGLLAQVFHHVARNRAMRRL